MKFHLLAGAALAALVATAPAARAEIMIGLIAPLTGPLAAVGAQVKNGTETAIEEINKNGGVLGEQLVLKVTDDAGEPKQGVSVANQLVGEDVRFVVGPVTSGVAVPASDVLAENGMLMVTPTATAPELTLRGLSTVFRTCGRDDQQAEVAARYVLDNFAGKRVAILNDKGQYGKGLADAFKATLNAAGVEEVFNDALTAGEKDFSALTTRLKQENVEVIYFGGYYPEAGLLARQLADIGLDAQIIGGDGLSSSEFATIGGEEANGVLFTNASDAQNTPDAKGAIEALSAKNIPAEAFTLNAYAAVQVIAAGIEKAGSADDAEAVATILKSGEEIQTTVGKLSYGETGDLSSPSFSMFSWQDGKTVAAE